jgi:hypothetical protein
MNLTAVNWGVGVVGQNDKLIFLLDNEETVTVVSTEIQSYTNSKYGSYYDHQYRIVKDDIAKLADHDLKSIRRYTSKGYADLDIKEKKQQELKNLSKVFLDELNKGQ